MGGHTTYTVVQDNGEKLHIAYQDDEVHEAPGFKFHVFGSPRLSVRQTASMIIACALSLPPAEFDRVRDELNRHAEMEIWGGDSSEAED